MKKSIRFDIPTLDQLRDPLSKASARYRALARETLAQRDVHPRMIHNLVPSNFDAVKAIAVIAIAKNNSVH